MKEVVTLNRKEQGRLRVLQQRGAGELTVGQAAELLGLSVRQTQRLEAAYRGEGAEALAHGNRGRVPWNARSPGERGQIIELARKYEGCNVQHMSELLAEREDRRISRSALRRLLITEGIARPRTRRAPKHRSRRERMVQEGMLLQIDGSRHDWLEGRGPYLTLIGGIDDATGKVPHALFREQEDAQGYFLLLEQLVRTVRCPLAVYRDRHGIFERSTKDRLTIAEQLAGKPDPTQFGRLLEELGIRSIAARSPQAKGRIERLWGTFQDRLVAELRLAGAQTIDAANRMLWEFLPRFNQRFSVPAAQDGLAYRPLEPGLRFQEVFCFKYERTVAADNTVQLGEHRLQLLPGPHRISHARARVEIQERMDGSLAVYHDSQQIASKPAPPEAPVLRVRGSRMTRRPPSSPEQPRPLSWKEVLQRSQPDTIATGVMIPAQTPGSRPRPGPHHPWRKS